MIPFIAKRTLVRTRFVEMAREARSAARKAAAWADFVEYRGSNVEQMPEVELDLLLADWFAYRENAIDVQSARKGLDRLAAAREAFAIRPSSRLPKPGEVWLHVGVDANGQPIRNEMRVCDPARYANGDYRVALLDHPDAVCLFPLSSLEFVRES